MALSATWVPSPLRGAQKDIQQASVGKQQFDGGGEHVAGTWGGPIPQLVQGWSMYDANELICIRQ